MTEKNLPKIFPLGSKVRDTVTGYVGIATSRTMHLSSDDEYGVERQNLQTGEAITEWFAVGRLEGAPIKVEMPTAEGSADVKGMG